VRPEPFIRDHTDLASPGDITARFNSGALLQFQCGNLDRAESLCRRAIDICYLGQTSEEFVSWIQAMYWPCVNLGRVASARGDTEECLNIYQKLYAAATDGVDVDIASYRVPIQRAFEYLQRGSTLGRTEQIFAKAPLMYAIESVRSLLGVGRPADALRFLDDKCSSQLEGRDVIYMELYLLCLLHLGRCQEIMSIVASYECKDREYSMVPLLLIRADAHARLGNIKEIASSVEGIDKLAQSLVKRYSERTAAAQFSPAYIYFRIALCMLVCGDAAAASQYAETSARLSSAIGNDSFYLKAAIIGSQVNERATELIYEDLESAIRAATQRFDRALGYACLASIIDNRTTSLMHLAAAHELAHSIRSIAGDRLCAVVKQMAQVSAGLSWTPSGNLEAPGDDIDILAEASFSNLMSYRPTIRGALSGRSRNVRRSR
jgi:tetratricopeptide (TPR) repeat protein